MRAAMSLLLISLVAMSSIVDPLKAQPAYGCDSSWTLQRDRNIFNGALQPNETTEDGCRAACSRNGTCQGIDFNQGNDPGQRCYLHSVTGPTFQANGVNHWDYNRTAPCAGICGRWIAFNDTGYYGGVVQPSAVNDSQCKSACLRNSTCVGFDWNYMNPAGQQCYLLFSKGSVYYGKGVTHWDYNSTAGCLSDCGLWAPFSNTGVPFGTEQPSVMSDDECKSTCQGIASCTGIDWNSGNDVGHQCYLHFDNGTKNSWAGVTHWDFNRTGICQVDCLNAFSAFPNYGVAGGTEQPSALTVVDCKKACIGDGRCQGIDWNESNDVGHRCYILYSNGPRNSWPGVNHYDFNRSTCRVDCLYAFNGSRDTGVAGGIEQPAANTDVDCKKACISDGSCQGIDWTASNDVGHRCYIIYSNGPKNNWPGVYHYDFNRSTCSASPSITCWNKTADSHAANGMLVSTATDVPSCQTACRNLNGCSTIDWDRLKPTNSSCYIFPNTQPSVPAPGVDHYVYVC